MPFLTEDLIFVLTCAALWSITACRKESPYSGAGAGLMSGFLTTTISVSSITPTPTVFRTGKHTPSNSAGAHVPADIIDERVESVDEAILFRY